MSKRFIIYILLVLAIVWYFRSSITRLYMERVTGLNAATDAETVSGYTTYNTQLYTPPFWVPLLNFFKAGSFAPPSQSNPINAVDYSVQG